MSVVYDDVLEYLASGEGTEEQLVEMRNAINSVIPEEVEEPSYWDIADEPTKIKLGEEAVPLVHRGRAQLDQVNRLREWLKVYARPLLDKTGGDENEQKLGVDMLITLLDPEALIELGQVLTLRDEDFVAENFDIGWIIDGVSRVVKHQPAIRKLAQGFFGRLG